MLYAERGDRLTDAGADRAKARALAAQPNLAVVSDIGGSRADRAKARALAAQPNLAGVDNACGGRTDFHGNLTAFHGNDFWLMPLHCRLQSSPATHHASIGVDLMLVFGPLADRKTGAHLL
jgi:hypothetical protein